MSQHAIATGQQVFADHDAQPEGLREVGREHGREHGTAERSGYAHDDQSRRGDATLSALEALSRALHQMSDDQELLEKRVKDLKRQRAEGRPWRDILSDEEPPGTMQVVSRMLACLAKASGTLRKELVDTLRSEGVSIPAIAKLFGVTHQRVSNLLRRPPD